MLRFCATFILIIYASLAQAQSHYTKKQTHKQDSIKKKELLKSLGSGFLPTKYFNADLRYLIKFNQFEGVRTGVGGATNNTFSKKYQINSYVVYGFKDHRFKYSIGGSFRLAKNTDTWLKASYTNDLQETGSTKFLTDTRFFQFFEPRLLNIDLFHKHITTALSLQHQITHNLKSETKLSVSNINPTYNYNYILDDKSFNSFHLSTAKIGLQWEPLKALSPPQQNTQNTKIGHPRFTMQYTKSFNNVLGSNFSFSKLDFRAFYKVNNKNGAFSEVTLVSGIASGNTPLTNLYHAYPNNITKDAILQRFSVAGLNSFETMYFNEFFSDKFTTLQFKHFLKPFNISARYKPQMVLITRFAVGEMDNIERHQNINFKTLNKGYTESGFELNKLLFGFGLSFSYRYGAYHLPEISDNMALKFTFNIVL